MNHRKNGFEADKKNFLDLQKLEILAGTSSNNVQVLATLIENYLDGAESLTDQIRAAMKDPSQVHRLSSRLKGLAGNVGARRVEELAFGLEEAGRNCNWNNISTLVAELPKTLEETAKELAVFLKAEKEKL